MITDDIARILDIPWPKLTELSKDPASLLALLSLAINKGIWIGQNNMNASYHEMMSGYRASQCQIESKRGY